VSARLAWALWALAVALTAIGLGFLVLNGSTRTPNSIGSPPLDGAFAVITLAFPTVGLLIASRRPGNLIGWLFLATGVFSALEEALLGWSTYTLLEEPRALPAGAAVAVLAEVMWFPTLVLGTTLLFLLFPDGRLPSPRWRPLLWFVAALSTAYVSGAILLPGPIAGFEGVHNPLGTGGPAADAARAAVDLGSGLVPPTIMAAAVALGLRFRRSRGDERQQIKWLVYTAGLLLALTPALVVMGELGVKLGAINLSDVVFWGVWSLVPVAVGMAILRHRLYDVDVVINRTLVYGALTATLAAAYLGTVLLLQLVLSPVTRDSGLAIAGSTLAVAALFRPARARIQALVDRRFYRRRYDAARTLEAFSARLRDEVDLEAVTADLRTVVRETVAPAGVTLWLREERR
jgi:hypothetical protein